MKYYKIKTGKYHILITDASANYPEHIVNGSSYLCGLYHTGRDKETEKSEVPFDKICKNCKRRLHYITK